MMRISPFTRIVASLRLFISSLIFSQSIPKTLAASSIARSFGSSTPSYITQQPPLHDRPQATQGQVMLGHADLSTTMIYTHIHDPEVEGALKSFRKAAAVMV